MAWTQVGSLRGPAGTDGADGADGAPGADGDDGAAGADGLRGTQIFTGTGAPGVIGGSAVNDLYIDTATGNLYKLS